MSASQFPVLSGGGVSLLPIRHLIEDGICILGRTSSGIDPVRREVVIEEIHEMFRSAEVGGQALATGRIMAGIRLQKEVALFQELRGALPAVKRDAFLRRVSDIVRVWEMLRLRQIPKQNLRRRVLELFLRFYEAIRRAERTAPQ